VVTEGDRFKLRALLNAPAYLYVVYENSAGEEAMVQPAGVRAQPGVSVELPRPNFSFQVDEHAGRTEYVHVIATPEPLPPELTAGFARQYRQLRGLGVVADPGATAALGWGDPTQVVSGYGGAVYTLLLEHR